MFQFFILRFLSAAKKWKRSFLSSPCCLNLFLFKLALIFCILSVTPIQAQREDYGLIKKNTVSDVDLLNDSNYTYTRILIAGDIQQEQSHLQTAFNKDSNAYIYTNWFKQIRPILFVGDIVIGNLETTFSGPPYSGTQYYSAPDDFLRILKRSGFNVLLNANDKITDFEGYGITRTLNKLDEIGFRHTGAFRSKQEKENNYPLILNVHQIKVAILNYTSQVKKQVFTEELYNKLSLSQVKRDIQEAKSKGAEYILVYMHWGNENDPKVLDYQKSIANACIEMGADAILGSHPHVFQPVEVRQVKRQNITKDVLIAYSLGDFLPASGDPAVNNSAIIEIQLKKHKQSGEVSVADFGYIPIWTKIEKNSLTVLPITNIDESEILNVRLNFKEYSEAKNAMNKMRGIMFERMDEIHYNISDKIVDDVDQTYLLQQENPSLSKVAERKVKDTLTKAQIAYIELFGTKEQKEKLNERFKSDKELEDARLMAFKSQIRKRELNRKALEEVVATFNKPVFEPQSVRPQVPIEKYNIRKSGSYVKVPKPQMVIMEINRSEMVYSINYKDVQQRNQATASLKKEPIISTARKNNFQDYPKQVSAKSNVSSSSNTTAVATTSENNDRTAEESSDRPTFETSSSTSTTINPSTIPANSIISNETKLGSSEITSDDKKSSTTTTIFSDKKITSSDSASSSTGVAKSTLIDPSTTISKNTNPANLSKQEKEQPIGENISSNSTSKNTADNSSVGVKKNPLQTESPNILPAAIYNAMNQQSKKTERPITNAAGNSSNPSGSAIPISSGTAAARPSSGEIPKQNFTTKIVSQVVDSSGKVQTVIRKLEVVANKPTPNLPYRPRTGGGIFTSQEPTPQETITAKTGTDPKKQNNAPEAAKAPVPEDVIYYVQVYAFTEKYVINTDLNPSLKYHEIVIEEGQYKYLVGKSRDMIQVSKLCQELREKGYTDAFMVKYVNGKRVPFIGN